MNTWRIVLTGDTNPPFSLMVLPPSDAIPQPGGYLVFQQSTLTTLYILSPNAYEKCIWDDTNVEWQVFVTWKTPGLTHRDVTASAVHMVNGTVVFENILSPGVTQPIEIIPPTQPFLLISNMTPQTHPGPPHPR